MASNYSSTADRLNSVNMLEDDRRLAKQQIERIERFLDAIWSLGAWSGGDRQKAHRRAHATKRLAAS